MSKANEVDSTALLACPFCGGKAIYFDGRNMKHVECYECGSSGAFMPTEERAIEAWNKRANTGSHRPSEPEANEGSVG